MFIFRKLFLLIIFFVVSPLLFAQQNDTNTQQSEQMASTDYLLSPGDIVSVIVFGEPDISSSSVRIPMSGSYNYPLIGDIVLTGESTTSLARKIESRLRAGFLSDPKVSVNIVSYRPVIVTGEVDTAGTIDYQEGMTVRVLSALAQIDSSKLALDQVEIQRNSQRFSPQSLDEQILPGDIVSYSAVYKIENYYYIYGEVNHSGRYPYEKGLTVEKAIIVAGGYTPFASKRNALVRRDGQDDTFKAKLHETVEPGDVITVKKRWF